MTGASPSPADAQRRKARLRITIALVAGVLGSIATLLVWASGEQPASDPVAALNEGNRLFRSGQLEDAVDAYSRGWAPHAAHPTLVYNLGTTLHHLGRIPEAVLWYRRAGEVEDPWLQDNLFLARRTLGSQSLPVGGVDGLLRKWDRGLRLAAIILSWLVLAWALARPNAPVWALVALAAVALALYGTAWTHARWGAKPAVLLADCSTGAGDLPAGTEAWVRPAADGSWRIAASSEDTVCPPDTIALIDAR